MDIDGVTWRRGRIMSLSAVGGIPARKPYQPAHLRDSTFAGLKHSVTAFQKNITFKPSSSSTITAHQAIAYPSRSLPLQSPLTNIAHHGLHPEPKPRTRPPHHQGPFRSREPQPTRQRPPRPLQWHPPPRQNALRSRPPQHPSRRPPPLALG